MDIIKIPFLIFLIIRSYYVAPDIKYTNSLYTAYNITQHMQFNIENRDINKIDVFCHWDYIEHHINVYQHGESDRLYLFEKQNSDRGAIQLFPYKCITEHNFFHGNQPKYEYVGNKLYIVTEQPDEISIKFIGNKIRDESENCRATIYHSFDKEIYVVNDCRVGPFDKLRDITYIKPPSYKVNIAEEDFFTFERDANMKEVAAMLFKLSRAAFNK